MSLHDAAESRAGQKPLFPFREDSNIRVFVPRPVRVGIDRGPARAWLNGPLIWAIDAAHSLLHLFPRDCPRILPRLIPLAGVWRSTLHASGLRLRNA